MNRFLDRILVNPRGLIGGVTTPKYHFTSRNDHTRKMFSSQSCDVFMFVTENEPCSIVSSLSHVDHISIENFFLLKPLFILCLLLFIIVVLYVNNWEGKSKGARSRGFPVRDDPSQVQGESDRRPKYPDSFMTRVISRYIFLCMTRKKFWTKSKDFFLVVDLYLVLSFK